MHARRRPGGRATLPDDTFAARRATVGMGVFSLKRRPERVADAVRCVAFLFLFQKIVASVAGISRPPGPFMGAPEAP